VEVGFREKEHWQRKAGSNGRPPRHDTDAKRFDGVVTEETTCRSNRVIDRPFCKFGPTLTNVVFGIRGRHLNRAPEADIDVPEKVCTAASPGGA